MLIVLPAEVVIFAIVVKVGYVAVKLGAMARDNGL